MHKAGLKAGTILLSLLIGMSTLLAAQQNDDPDWDYYDDLNARGDQTFIISLGTIFPTIFRSNGETIKHNLTPPVGGTGSLAYNYYFFKQLYVGGEVGGMFINTLGSNTLFIIPIGLRGGFQFNFNKLEFPVTAVVGMALHRFLGGGYFGLYLKGGAAAFYRLTNNWSFGINCDWFWLPQWTGEKYISKPDGIEKSKNVYGNMIDLTLSARYHF
jgi:hypothetical protein